MALPVQSIRAKAEHRGLLQAVADLLKSGEEEAVRRFLEDRSNESIGLFRNEDAALNFIATQLSACLDPAEIWLFGSRGRRKKGLDHKVGPSSDFDLLIVLPDGLPDEAYDYFRIAQPLASSGLAYDIVPALRGDFERDKAREGSLCWRAVHEGVQLYRRAEKPKRRAA